MEAKTKFKPSSIHLFKESDGWHWSPKGLGYLDARSPGYPTKKEAIAAAKKQHEYAKEFGN